jgi:TRL-like protein family
MIRKAIALSALAMFSTGCAMSMGNPVTGALYSGNQGPTAATSNPIGAKKGESCAMSILGIVGLGDASIASAAKAGGVSKISTVDSNNFQVLGIYATNCTVVTGE